MTDNPQPGRGEPADRGEGESAGDTDPPSASWLDPEYSSNFWSSYWQDAPEQGEWGDPARNPWDGWAQGGWQQPGGQQPGFDAHSGGWGARTGDADRAGWGASTSGGDRVGWGGAGSPPHGWGPDPRWQGPWGAGYGTPPPGSRGPATGRVGRLISVFLAIGLIAVVAVAGVIQLRPAQHRVAPILGGPGSRLSSPANGGAFGAPTAGSPRTNPPDVQSVGNKVAPELVDINTTLSYSQEEAAGTGIVLNAAGLILTNNHVIDGETSLRVTDIANGKTYGGTVIGYDHADDIAVIQLTGASGLPIATLGDSSTLTTGESVVAIGNAGGAGGQPSITGGSISDLNQSITASDEGGGSTEQLNGLIESSTDIQPGDSGGALVDMSGHVIGIDTAAADALGFGAGGPRSEGYAIPINRAISIARTIVAGKGSSTVHVGPSAFLGVEIDEPTPAAGAGQQANGQGGSGQGTSGGVRIKQAFAHGAAADAGLTAGDTITALGATRVASSAGLTSLLEGYHPGQSVSVGYVDGQGRVHTASVTLQSGPPS